jgi:hypothetical protein
MSGKKKDNRNKLSDFLRYRENKMTNEERNAFERDLQRDPFATEAAEGFSEATSSEASKDINLLQKRLNKRLNVRKNFVYYRIAAAVAVLMIASSIFIVVERNKPHKDLGENSGILPVLEISESKAVKPPAGNIKETNTVPAVAGKERNKKSELPVQISQEKIAALTTADEAKRAGDEKIQKEKIEVAENKPQVLNVSEIKEPMASPATILSKQENVHQVEINLEPSISSLNEVVVVGYGVQRKNYDTGAAGKVAQSIKTSGKTYIPPQPSEGMENFEKYVGDNMHIPEMTNTGQRAIVLLRFTVRSNGVVDSIKILESPSRIYSDETIRLIKEGPAWSPATDNGIKIDNEVKIRVVFK